MHAYISDLSIYSKVIEMLAVQWFGTKLMHADLQRDYYKRRKLAAGCLAPGNDDEVSIICFPHILYWRVTVEKNTSFCSLKVHTLKNFSAVHTFPFV